MNLVPDANVAEDDIATNADDDARAWAHNMVRAANPDRFRHGDPARKREKLNRRQATASASDDDLADYAAMVRRWAGDG